MYLAIFFVILQVIWWVLVFGCGILNMFMLMNTDRMTFNLCCRIHQQLSKDQENALRPDTHTPFHNQRDMTRRLLRYHVFQWAEPPKKLIKKGQKSAKFRPGCLKAQFWSQSYFSTICAFCETLIERELI